MNLTNPNNMIDQLRFEILATASNGCWGKGATLEAARKQCMKAGGRGPFNFILLPKGSELRGSTIEYPVRAAFKATKLGSL